MQGEDKLAGKAAREEIKSRSVIWYDIRSTYNEVL